MEKKKKNITSIEISFWFGIKHIDTQSCSGEEWRKIIIHQCVQKASGLCILSKRFKFVLVLNIMFLVVESFSINICIDPCIFVFVLQNMETLRLFKCACWINIIFLLVCQILYFTFRSRVTVVYFLFVLLFGSSWYQMSMNPADCQSCLASSIILSQLPSNVEKFSS